MNQKSKVIEQLELYGEVNNFWAIHNYILRLGDIMFRLKKKGWEWEGKFGKERGFDPKYDKNYYYILSKKPAQLSGVSSFAQATRDEHDNYSTLPPKEKINCVQITLT